MKDFLSQAAKLLKERKQYRRRVAVFLCLAVIVGYGTVAALKLYGQAMTHTAEVLDCEYKVHEHTDECYERDEEGNLGTEPVCGYADYVIHVHNDSCCNKNGSLVCSLEEHKPHEHTGECYMTERILVCGNESEDDAAGEGSSEGLQAALGSSEAAAGEAPGEVTGSAEASGNAENTGETAESAAETEDGEESRQEDTVCGEETHKHDENCYENVLSCGYTEEHVHIADCVSHELVCEEPEHMHVEECYDAEGNLVCGMEEHSHEIGCYDEESNTLCNTEDHIHDESCLNAEGKITCGPEGHEHITGCYRNYYNCDKEAHTHGDSCYIQTQVCEIEEHEHIDECYTLTEEGTAGAGAEENTESRERETEEGDDPEGTEEPSVDGNGDHIHTDACYQEVKILICGEEELHIHEDSCYTEECFDEKGNLIEGSRPSCGLLKLEEHIHKEDCLRTVELTPEEVAALNNGAKLHIHEDSCYDEEGKLVCGHDATHIHEPECYDDAGKLICGFGEDEKKVYLCGKEEHTHGEECFGAEENLTCKKEEHTHDESCLEKKVYLCGKEEHTHSEECFDAEENLTCRKEEHTHDETCLEEKAREEIEKVNQLIAGLPSQEEIAQKIAEYEETGEDGEEAFDEYMAALLVQIQEAYDAYLVLDEALREHVEGAECLSALWELMETVWLGDVPDTVPEYAAFLPVGDQGGGMVLELLYGDEKTHAEEPYGKENYTNYEMQGLFKLYTTGIQGNTTIDQVTMSLYFPKAYMDKEQIRIKEFPESIGKHEISAVTEESRDGEEYYKISITFTDYVPTGALKLPFVMKFKVAEVPADYQLKIFGTIESGEGEEKKTDTTAENIYRPKYNKPVITKYVNTNKYESMKEDYTRVAARVGEDGILTNDQYVSFWYKLGDAHWTLRAYNKITLTDRLPQYVDYDGNTRYAVFDSEANPGWTLNEDGISVSRVFEVEEGLEPEKYDNTLMLQIEAAELKLQFPGCKIDEPDKDNFLTKNLTNHVGAVCEPVRPSKGENEDACEDDLIFTLTTQPGAEGSFTKGNSADTVMDTPDTRSGGYMWTLAFENKGASPLVNIVLGDEEIDQRLKFQCVMFRDTLLKELDHVEAFTYDGGTDIYNLKDSEQYGDYFKNTGHNGSLGGIVWKLELVSGREYKGFKVHFREGCELKSGEGITVWPFSTFRKPEEKHFIRDEGRDSENIYKNRAYVAYQEKGSEDGTTHFLFSENKFKLIDTFEKVWIEKEMYYGDNLDYPSIKKDENGNPVLDKDGNPVMDYSKSYTFCMFYVKGALDAGKEYDDLRVVDLLPEALELYEYPISYGAGSEYVKETEVIENYHNSGRTAVIFWLNVEAVRKTLDASDGESGQVYFSPKVRVKADASPGSYVNDVYLMSDDFEAPPTGHGQMKDIYDLEGKGTDNMVRWDQAGGSIKAPAGIYAEKYIAKKDSMDWKKTVLRFKVGEEFQYKLSIINTTDTPHSNLTVYDVLPRIGDRSINNQAGRGSEFTVELTDRITLPHGYQVYYTNSEEVYRQDMASLLGAGIWTRDVADWNQITAFKIVADEGILFYEDSIDFVIPVKVTDSLSEESYGILDRKEAADRDTGTAVYLEATNSFGYSTKAFPGANVESNYVRAQISLAGFVVRKTDDNGKLLPGAEFKLEKLEEQEQTAGGADTESGTAQNEDGNTHTPGNANQDQEWKVIATVTSGGEGKVSFKNLTEGTYRLTETKAPDGYKLLKDPVTVTITLNETTMEYTVTAMGLAGSGTGKDPFVIVNEAFYELPETGGAGSKLYTMAGAACLMLGAGFLYKKKFRERRV